MDLQTFFITTRSELVESRHLVPGMELKGLGSQASPVLGLEPYRIGSGNRLFLLNSKIFLLDRQMIFTDQGWAVRSLADYDLRRRLTCPYLQSIGCVLESAIDMEHLRGLQFGQLLAKADSGAEFVESIEEVTEQHAGEDYWVPVLGGNHSCEIKGGFFVEGHMGFHWSLNFNGIQASAADTELVSSP
jgi:hypothetical protein